jgi:hypothetical protein
MKKEILFEEIIRTRELMGLINENTGPGPFGAIATFIKSHMDDAVTMGKRIAGNANEMTRGYNALRTASTADEVIEGLSILAKSSDELAQIINPRVYQIARRTTGYDQVISDTINTVQNFINSGGDLATAERHTDNLLNAAISDVRVKDMLKDEVFAEIKTAGRNTPITPRISWAQIDSVIETAKRNPRYKPWFKQYGAQLDLLLDDAKIRLQGAKNLTEVANEIDFIVNSFSRANPLMKRWYQKWGNVIKNTLIKRQKLGPGELPGEEGIHVLKTFVSVFMTGMVLGAVGDMAYRMNHYDEGLIEAAANVVKEDAYSILGVVWGVIVDGWTKLFGEGGKGSGGKKATDPAPLDWDDSGGSEEGGKADL